MPTSRPYTLRGFAVDERPRGPIEPFCRIMVVDDDAALNELVAVALRHVGYNVATAGDGEAAWAALRAEPFDLLLTDFSMPRLDGLQLLERVREHHMVLPSVLMSGHLPPDLSQLLDCVSAGGTLHKPFGLHELFYKVGSVLDAGRPGPVGGLRDSRDLGRAERVMIKQATDARLSELAETLLIHETLLRGGDRHRAGTVRICRQMQDNLHQLWGLYGFRALLCRALAFVRTSVPWMAGVTVSDQGELEGIPPAQPLSPAELYRGQIALLTQILDQVVSLLGESVARACFQEMWRATL